MKKSVAITTVLALHVAAIGILLAQPGCSSEPEQPKLGSAETTTQEISEKALDPALNDGTPSSSAPDAAPSDVITPPEGSLSLRAAPTRPVWNMDSSDEVIVKDDGQKQLDSDKSEKLEPKSPAKKDTIYYTVKKGDTLGKIAKAHRVSLSELLKENNLNMKSVLKIGQSIAIPGSAEAVGTPKVKPSDLKPSLPGTETETYTVKKGDTLGKIAIQHGMSVATLKSVNSLSSDMIRVGQKLTVSKKDAKDSSAKIEKPVEKAADGEEAITIKSGDTLGKIALKYGTTVSAIMKRNNIKNPSRIIVGKTLYVPSKAPEKKAPAPVKVQAETSAPETTPPPAPTVQVQQDEANTSANPVKTDENIPPVDMDF